MSTSNNKVYKFSPSKATTNIKQNKCKLRLVHAWKVQTVPGKAVNHKVASSKEKTTRMGQFKLNIDEVARGKTWTGWDGGGWKEY